jgi:hypothetical protein
LLGQELSNVCGYVDANLVEKRGIADRETEPFRRFVDLFRLNSFLYKTPSFKKQSNNNE